MCDVSLAADFILQPPYYPRRVARLLPSLGYIFFCWLRDVDFLQPPEIKFCKGWWKDDLVCHDLLAGAAYRVISPG